MTGWTREFIEGRTVYVVQVDRGDMIGASDAVFQLLPQLQTGEEIRIRPAVREPGFDDPVLPWGVGP